MLTNKKPEPNIQRGIPVGVTSFETGGAQKQRATGPVLQRCFALGIPGHRSLPAVRAILAGEGRRNLAGEDTVFPGFVTGVVHDPAFEPVGPFLVAALAVAALLRPQFTQVLKDQDIGSVLAGKVHDPAADPVCFTLFNSPDFGPQMLIVRLAFSQNPGFTAFDGDFAQQPFPTSVQEGPTANEQGGSCRPVGLDNGTNRLGIPQVQINRAHFQVRVHRNLLHRLDRFFEFLFQRGVQPETTPALDQDRAARFPTGLKRSGWFSQVQLDPLPARAAVEFYHQAVLGPLFEHPGIEGQIEVEGSWRHRRAVMELFTFGGKLLFLFLPAPVVGIKGFESAPGRIDGRPADHCRNISLYRFIKGPEGIGIVFGAMGKFFGLAEGFFLIQVEQQRMSLVQFKVESNDPVVQRFGLGLPGSQPWARDNIIALSSGCLGHDVYPATARRNERCPPVYNRTCVLAKLSSSRAKALKRKPAYLLALKGGSLRQAESRSNSVDRGWVLANRGVTYRKMRCYEEAIADFNEAIRLRPDIIWALGSRGNTYWWMKRNDEALADFNHALKLDSKDPQPLVLRGVTYRDMGRFQEAFADFESAIKLSADRGWVLANRAVTYQKVGCYDEALKDINQAIELRPDIAWALGVRGEIYQELGCYEEALINLNRALDLDPKLNRAIAARG